MKVASFPPRLSKLVLACFEIEEEGHHARRVSLLGKGSSNCAGSGGRAANLRRNERANSFVNREVSSARVTKDVSKNNARSESAFTTTPSP
jgi:hypothetical protein